MRRILFSLLAIILVFGVVNIYAQEGCGGKAAAKSSGGKSCCANKGAQASCAKMMSQDKGASKEGCPDVTGRAALTEFHTAMHSMHQALGANDFVALREGLPQLLKTTDGVKDYKCDGNSQCSKECRKDFDNKKSALLKSVKDLKKACKGNDDQKVADKFNVMHEAYIAFAGVCSPKEGAEGSSERTQ